MAESLKIMGLNRYMYALSFLLTRTMWVSLTTLIMSVMVFIINSDFITFGMFIQIFLSLWLLAVSNLGLSLVAQNMFKDVKLASICAPFMLFLPTGVALLCVITPITTGSPNTWVQYLYFLPTFPFEVILADIFQIPGSMVYFETSPTIAWVVLAIQTPIYFFIHIYLDAIIPDSYGVTQTCFYCCKRRRSQGSDDQHDEEADSEEVDLNESKMSSTIQDQEARDQLPDTTDLESRLLSPEPETSAKQPSMKRRDTEGRKAFNSSDPI